MTELIKIIFNLKEQITAKEAELAQLKADTECLKAQYDELSAQLLSEMKSSEQIEVDVDDIVAQYFCKNEFSYGDEKALLAYLINNNMNNYITTKTTQAINKAALKKDLKANESLKESLNEFVGDKKTEYVVVTTKENHQRMLEHIEETKSSKGK